MGYWSRIINLSTLHGFCVLEGEIHVNFLDITLQTSYGNIRWILWLVNLFHRLLIFLWIFKSPTKKEEVKLDGS